MMSSVSTTNINSNDLYENCNNGIAALRKNLSYSLFIIIIRLGVIEMRAIFSYFYFKKKYHSCLWLRKEVPYYRNEKKWYYW